MPKPRRILGYARVSSLEQTLGTSLQDQQDAIRAHAQKRGLKVDRMYVEAESGIFEKAERRDQIQALMANVREGDLVLVDKIDRWSRDPEFTYGSVRQILARGAAYYAIGDDCDPSTAAGDSMLGLRVFFAREEHKRIKLRMVGTRKLLRDRGYYVEGLPPIGYRRQDVRGVDRNVLVLVADEVARVREIYRLCISGHSINEIAESLGITRDLVHDTLKNRLYLGEQRNSLGEWMRGRHEAIIDPATFAAARASSERRFLGERKSRGAASETSTWWLRDLTVCGFCGRKMSSSYAGPHNARRYYYRCSARCATRGVGVRGIEALAETMVVARLEELREEIAGARSTSEPTKPVDVADRRQRLAAKRARYLELFAEGEMDRAQLRARLDALREQELRLDALAVEPPKVTVEQRRAALRALGRMTRTFLLATPLERRAMARTIARSVAISFGEPPRFDWYTADELTRRG